MTISRLSDFEALEDRVGERPVTAHLKSIPDLDEHCQALLAASPFAVVGAMAGDGSQRTVAVGGAPGVLAVSGPTTLQVPSVPGLDVPGGAATSLLVFVPGYRETLRINGNLRADGTLDVGEAFLHCAKAIIRSKLWAEAAPPVPPMVEGTAELSTPDVAAFLTAAPFVAVSSCDAGGEADVSPKGDPPGSLVMIVDDHTVAIADRPGNRRTDTMHNIVSNDAVGLLAFVPGSEFVVELRGRGAITDDEAIREALAVNGKVPKAAITITVDHLEVRREQAIAAAGLWDTSRHADVSTLPKGTQIWVDHCNRNDDPGEMNEQVRQLLTTEKLDVGIANDYRDNLY